MLIRLTIHHLHRGEALGRFGGEDLMRLVLRAYAARYGADKAGRLSDRWVSAAGIWH